MSDKSIGGPVGRDDIEAKLAEIRGGVDETATAAKPTAMVIAVAAAVLVVTLAYLLGQRKARKRTTLVEIRRV